MDQLLTPTVYILVFGGVAGYFMGHLIRKIWSMAATIGVFAFLFILLIFTRAIDLNLEVLGRTAAQLASVFGSFGVTALASSIPFIGSFVVGLFLALRRG